MAFTVQNDLGTEAGANSYCTVAEFKTYHADRGNDISGLTDPQIEVLLVNATQYLDGRFNYCGCKLEGRDQTTLFPRADLYDSEGYLVEGVPAEIKTACNEYAFHSQEVALNSTTSASDSSIKREMSKVDVIEKEIEYSGSKGTFTTNPSYTFADTTLENSGFVCDNSAFNVRF